MYEDACVAIGVSTGGPSALFHLFSELRPPLPPIVVVQHMPPNFTASLARRLDANSALCIVEGASGQKLLANQVTIAAAGKHLRLARRGKDICIKLAVGKGPVSGHRPSVDVMMSDAADIFGPRCLGVIMTGMGRDGCDGCFAIKQAGGYVLGQDKASSDVYGMNKLACQQGNVDREVALCDLPKAISDYCHFALCNSRAKAKLRN